MCYFRNGELSVENISYGDTRDCYETVYASAEICNYLEIVEDDVEEDSFEDDAEDSVEVVEGPECEVVTLYAECDYLGSYVELDETDNCLEFEPKSLCVPEDQEVTLFNICGLTG